VCFAKTWVVKGQQVGVIEYADKLDFEDALEHLQGLRLGGRRLVVYEEGTTPPPLQCSRSRSRRSHSRRRSSRYASKGYSRIRGDSREGPSRKKYREVSRCREQLYDDRRKNRSESRDERREKSKSRGRKKVTRGRSKRRSRSSEDMGIVSKPASSGGRGIKRSRSNFINPSPPGTESRNANIQEPDEIVEDFDMEDIKITVFMPERKEIDEYDAMSNECQQPPEPKKKKRHEQDYSNRTKSLERRSKAWEFVSEEKSLKSRSKKPAAGDRGSRSRDSERRTSSRSSSRRRLPSRSPKRLRSKYNEIISSRRSRPGFDNYRNSNRRNRNDSRNQHKRYDSRAREEGFYPKGRRGRQEYKAAR